MTSTSGAHAGRELITRYVTGEGRLPADAVWALEAHLENCARCRAQVADTVAAHAPATAALLDRVWAEVDTAAVGRPAPLRSRLLRVLRTWAPPSQLPWLLMSVLVTLVALGVDMLAKGGPAPSLVALIAPVVPLLGVAAAWTRNLDPMGELTVATPRAGLQLVLRRTATVLVVVIPVLALAGGITGVSPVVWLLPSLAFTLGTLALGTVLGVGRAAVVLGGLWVLAVIVPSLLLPARLPLLLEPAGLPGWGLVALVAAVVITVRARVFTTIPSTELT